MRMSYVGELGYELHIKSSGKGVTSIFETLYSAKNVSLAGFEALNSMSLEKGHRQEQTNYRTGPDHKNHYSLQLSSRRYVTKITAD